MELRKKLNEHAQYPEKKQANYLGRHILAEFFDCDSNILNNLELIEKNLSEAAVACGAHIVQTCFHMFSPHGVSGVVIISESHLAIHTWPELGYAAVDLFTCGESCDPKIAYDFLKQAFASKSGSYSELRRGILASPDMVQKTPFCVKDQVEA